MFFPGLKLNVFFLNDSTDLMTELEADFSLGECDIKEVIFYTIDAVVPFMDEQDNDRVYASIHSPSSIYITNYTMEQLEEKINLHLKYYNNILFMKS